tara:strand:- start:1396 stop:1593 length:198 start_codon:yes stop_codon:yes gene_type:complete
MIKSYLDQLIELAEETGWKLKEACTDSGISDATFYRWMKGSYSPRHKQAVTVANFMLRYRQTPAT